MDNKTQGIIHLVFAIGVIAAVVYFSKDIASLGAYGYLGAFLISVLASATLFFPAPGWAVVIALSSSLNPVFLGAVAGIGSAIGELTGYFAGESVRELLDERVRETKQIKEIVEKYDMLAIAFLAFIPNPLFDVAGIIAGGLKIPWWKFIIACAVGRVARYVLLAMIGNFALTSI